MFNDEQSDLFAPRLEGTKKEQLATLAASASACTACSYHKNRRKSVFASGTADAKIMLIAEGPGRNENDTGKPFVGAAGEILEKILTALSLKKTDIYICNIVKCWTGIGNPSPVTKSIKACRHYLVGQIEIVKPKVIVATGNYALIGLLGSNFSGIVKETGNIRKYGKIPVVPTIHPAAFLRPKDEATMLMWKRSTWKAWKLAKELAYGTVPQRVQTPSKHRGDN